MDITASPHLPEPEEIHTLVVYDPETGRIVHRHSVITYPGAQRRTKEELEARAIEMARSQTDYKKSLTVLHAESQAFAEPAEYSVDLSSRQLVRGPVFSMEPSEKKKSE